MTFLTILGVTEILYSFKLFLEGKVGKGVLESSSLEFLEKILGNNFALSDHLCAVKYRSYRIFTPVEKTISNSPKGLRAKVLRSDGLLAYASLAASRTLLQSLLAFLNFTLDSEDLFCWCK